MQDGLAEAIQGNISPESWLRQHAYGARGGLIRAILWAVSGGLLVIIQARLLASICHRVVMKGGGIPSVINLLALFSTVLLFRALSVWRSEDASAKVSATVRQSVRSELYRRLLLLKPAGSAGESGPLTELTTAGVDGLDSYISRFIPQLALAATLPLAMLFVLLPVEWRASLVLIFSAPFIPLLMVLIGKGTERLNRRQFDRLSRMAGHLLDLIQGLPDLKIFGVAKQEAGVVARISDEYRLTTMSVLRVAFLSAFTLEFFSTVGTAVVAVIIGFRLLSGGLSLLDGLFVLLLAPEFYLPLRNLGLSYHSRMNGIAAAEKIMPVLTGCAVIRGHVLDTCPRITPTAPAISCESVTFRYGGDRGGVSDISITIPANSITALAGASGSGKSTLARLLLGLSTPESGRVLVNGTDILELNRNEWLARLAWVPQQPFFFNASIRENLVMGQQIHDDDAIRIALEKAALWPVISALPMGIETVLGDSGAGLSGGELRRLAMARALLRNASVVLMDEPTAGLDHANEQLVLDTIEAMAEERTVILISHREESITRCSQVIELSGGTLLRITTPLEYSGGKR